MSPTSGTSQVPDFSSIDLGDGVARTEAAHTDSSQATLPEPWLTPEQIEVKALYTEEDLEGLDFLDTVPGAPPFATSSALR